MRAPPIPEPVYDAALRVITRDALPDDADRLEQWHKSETTRTLREIALEVMREVSERGVEGRT